VSRVLRGRVWKYGDGVTTQAILAPRHAVGKDPAEWARHALEDWDPAFTREARPGDIIVAGRDWGAGPSRDEAVICLKARGIGAILAASVARPYFRACINEALPAVNCPEASTALEPGERIEVDLAAGEVRHARGVCRFAPLPDAILDIVEAGGLLEFTRQRLGIAGPPAARGRGAPGAAPAPHSSRSPSRLRGQEPE
jgi:3-isopropylmalate/(R)-2-methylmalate dehydratase small subunit